MAKKKTKKKNSFWGKIKSRQEKFLDRRVHRSFKLTRRRDYSVSLPISGYFSFTSKVFKIIGKNKWLFSSLLCVGVFLAIMTSSIMAQDRYLEIVDVLRETSETAYGEALTLMSETGTVLITIFFNVFNDDGGIKNPYTILIALLIWLTSIWLVRSLINGKKITLREGLYNSGGPILSTFLVFTVGILQLLPAIIAIIILTLALINGAVEYGVVSMAATIGVFGISIISFYFITSTFIALVIVALPGMYPMRAIKLAGDLVSGIRLRILYRILWLLVLLAIIIAVILGAFILVDILLRSWLDWFASVPLVPFVSLVLTVSAVIFSSVYIYMLYLEIVEARHERIS